MPAHINHKHLNSGVAGMLRPQEIPATPPDTGFADSAIDHVGSIPAFNAASHFEYF